MYRALSVIAIVPVYNEEGKIADVLSRAPRDVVDELLVVDDGSSDCSVSIARENGASVTSLGSTVGVGAALRTGYAYAVEGAYDVAVVMAGNNKDTPEEIPLLLDPIAENRADFVQGSRYLSSRPRLGPMPLYRKVATRLHPLLFRLVTHTRVTDSTNGFRAVHTRVLRDPALNLSQKWLNQYELEPYLYIRAIQLGYRTTEVPVTKTYPPKRLGQTKMRPVTGWWSILRPLVLVGLGIRR